MVYFLVLKRDNMLMKTMYLQSVAVVATSHGRDNVVG